MVLQPDGQDEAPQPIEPPAQMPEASPPLTQGMPSEAWQGLDPDEMEKLLARAPTPLPSPSLADALAKALAAGSTRDRRDMTVRVAALERSGHVAELVELLRGRAQSGEPAALARYALALLASGQDGEACAIELGAAAADIASDAKRAAFSSPRIAPRWEATNRPPCSRSISRATAASTPRSPARR